jgi:pilus assembly protein FimV
MIEGNGVRTLKIKRLSLAVFLAFLPLSSGAAGLGKLTVSSNLGEPFKGVIELLATTPEEMETLVAVIASEEAYAAQGITRLGIHSDIKVEIVDPKSARPKLKLSSSQAVTEPYIDMLIQLDWASGRLQREYTVLLDPPGYKQPLKNEEVEEIKSPTPDTAADATKIANETPAEKPNTQPETSEIDDQLNALQEAPKPVRAKPTQRKTKSGDSLSKIAQTMRVDGVSLDQMLVALYENNKDAFVGENMNRLKVGKVIKLPSKEAILATPRTEANKTVQLHVTDWQSYRSGLASAVPAIKTDEPTPTPSQTDSGKIVAAEKPAEAPTHAEPQDVVKLSAGEKDKASKDPKKAEEAKKAAAQEDKVAHDKTLAEAKSRTEAVEKQIEDMQKLLAMKNKAMTELQKKAEADLATQKQAENTPKPEATKPEAEKPEAKPAEHAAEEPAKDTPTAESPKAETTTEVAPAEAAPPVAQEPPKEEPKPAPVKPPVAKAPEAPVEEPSFIASIMESINVPLLAGLGAIGLLAGGWMFLRNKRRKDLESFERGILTSGGLKANTVFGNTTGSTSSTDTSFLTDFAQSADGAMLDTNEVDPIAEAEVYMAYGRDAQAEEILKDAIGREPKRYELHLKLLEMYAARKDTSAFEAIAGELYTTLGSDDPNWEKVATLGRELEPSNPLYKVNAAPTPESKSPAQSDDITETQAESIPEVTNFKPEENAAEATTSVVADSNTINFDEQNIEKPAFASVAKIDSIVRHSPAQEDSETSTSASELSLSDTGSLQAEDLEFDLDEKPSTKDDVALEQNLGMSVEELDFDLDQAEAEDKPKSASTSAPDANLKSFDLSGINLNLDEPTVELTLEEPAPSATTSEPNAANIGAANNDVEVKLNLVSAYIDMDDKEGARELLEEVLKEGNEEQVVKAQMILDSIA